MDYKSLDSYEIKGRGTVFMVENDKDRQTDNTGLIGKVVTIDNVFYKVKGVESKCMLTIRKGDLIGLLI